jgi:hypothetical protein
MKPFSESKIRTTYFSTFIRDIFEAAQDNLDRKDFEAIRRHLNELGRLHLQRASSVTENLAGALGDTGMARDWFDMKSIPDVLFLLHNTMDTALGLIETAAEARYIADHYEEYKERRAMCARAGDDTEEHPSTGPKAEA